MVRRLTDRRPVDPLIAQGDEDPAQMAQQPDFDDGRQFDFPDTSDALHFVEAILLEVIDVVREPQQVQPLFHARRRTCGHFLQRSGQRCGSPAQDRPVLVVADAQFT